MKTIVRLVFFAAIVCLLVTACQKNKNQIGANILNLSSIDSSIRPQDDFFRFVNGKWLDSAVIPASESMWGSFVLLGEKSTNDLHTLLENLVKGQRKFKKGSIEQLTSDLYISGMDSVAIEELGIEPLKAELQIIAAINEPQDILEEVAREIVSGVVTVQYGFIPNHIVTFYSLQDDKNSEQIVAHFDQGDLGLPTRDYYLQTDSASNAIRTAYGHYISGIFILLGDDSLSAAQKAKAILDLETKLAEASKSPVELRDPLANYNKLAIIDLDKQMPDLRWIQLIQNLGTKLDTVLVGQPAYYEALNKLLYSEPLDSWKDYLAFRMVKSFAAYLSSNFYNTNFDFYGKILSGQMEQKPRWKRMTYLVDDELGDALGQLYVKEYFPPKAKERMDQLVENLIKAYGIRIEKAAWMNDSTKQKAMEKLAAVTRKIGYPDKWIEYKEVEIGQNDLIANLKSTRKFAYQRMIAKIGKPVDRTAWFMTPPTVNAYYYPNQNEIVFPAGILQPPFFNTEADDAVNYGAIGTVIAHEITHGFDDQGRKFDSKGNLTDWWTEEDATKFTYEASRIIEQYNKFHVIDSMFVNGELTQGENLADLGGIMIAYEAFMLTEQGKGTERIDGYTPAQRFFISYAQSWQLKITDELLRQLVLTDPHSPFEFRVNGPLSNCLPFYAAFNVQPGDKLYKPDSLQIKVW
jgi:putative endopeptidase